MSQKISIHASTREYGTKMIDITEEMQKVLSLMQDFKEELIRDGVSGNITKAYDEAFESNKDAVNKNSNTIAELGSRLLTAQDMHEELDNWAHGLLQQKA